MSPYLPISHSSSAPKSDEPEDQVPCAPPGRVLSGRQPLLGAGEKCKSLGPTPAAQPEAASEPGDRQCASSLKGAVGPPLTLSVPCALHCGGLSCSLLLAGVVLGDGTAELSLGQGYSPSPCSSRVKLSGQQADLPMSSADSQQPSRGLESIPAREVTAQGAHGRARSRALPEAAVPGSVWSLGEPVSCVQLAPSVGESAHFFPVPCPAEAVCPWCLGSSFLSVIVFLSAGTEECARSSVPASYFCTSATGLACVSQLCSIGVKFPSC